MGLGLSEGGGGNFVPFVKYDAKSGRWLGRFQTGTDREGKPVWEDRMIPDASMVFVADLDNIEVGWISFGTGRGPDKVLALAKNGKPEKPVGDHKSGFRMMVYSEANIGGLREWMSNSAAANGAMNALYDAYEAEVGAHPGECPVVQFKGVEAVGKGEKTNYKPVLEIVQWTARPAAFDGDEARVAQATPTAPAAAAVPPPVAPAPQPVVRAAGGMRF